MCTHSSSAAMLGSINGAACKLFDEASESSMKTKHLLSVLLSVICSAATVASLAPAIAAAQGQGSLIGSWLVTADGFAETRTLVVTEEAPTNDGALLGAKYGITSQGQGPVSAKMLRVGEQRQLFLVTQAGTKIAATEQTDGTFKGTFTLTNGSVKEVTIVRISEAMRQQLAQPHPTLAPQKQGADVTTTATSVQSLSVFPMGAVAQVAEMPKPEAFKRGDRWEWRQIDDRTNLEEGKQTRTVVSAEGVQQFSYGNSRGQISAAFLGNPAKKAWRVWPLEVGKKWAHDEDWARPDGVTGNTQADVAVVAYEEVEVPAGKFTAFKIEHRGFYTNSIGGRVRQQDTYWYSPAVAADVKHMRDDGYNVYTRELLSFKRSAP